MTELTPEQKAFFDRAERVFGAGSFSEVIEDAKGELVRRNASGGVVRGEARIIGFVPNEKDKGPDSE